MQREWKQVGNIFWCLLLQCQDLILHQLLYLHLLFTGSTGKHGKQKITYLIGIDLPAVDQRNLEDLELIFPRVHTPRWAQCTCPGPPRASRRWARRSYRRGAGRGATATEAAHRTNPYFSKELFRSDYYFSLGFWQKKVSLSITANH